MWQVFWRTEDRHPRVTCRAKVTFPKSKNRMMLFSIDSRNNENVFFLWENQFRFRSASKMLFRDPEGELLHSPNGPAGTSFSICAIDGNLSFKVRDGDETDKRAFLFFKSKSMIILPEKIGEEKCKQIRTKGKDRKIDRASLRGNINPCG